MSTLINVDVNLTQSLSEAIVVNEKTGDKWVNLTKLAGDHIYQNANKAETNLKITVAERKEADTYGNTHSVRLQQSKAAREAKAPIKYVGQAKAITFGGAAPAAAQGQAYAAGGVERILREAAQAPAGIIYPSADDLPF